MRRERISEHIYAFFSDEYAEVAAALVLARHQAVLVDTLPFPHETRQIREFLKLIGREKLHYVVNTHYHSDHTYGGCLFPEATVVAHHACRQMLAQYGRETLAEAKESTPSLAEVELRLPEITFSGEMALCLGDLTLKLLHLPGHTPDSCVAFVEEERILLAGDTVTPIPLFASGDMDQLLASLSRLKELPIEAIVQGHGEVILRGEVRSRLNAGISYLKDIRGQVKRKLREGAPEEKLEEIGLGKYVEEPMVVLQGLVYELHRVNLRQLYRSLKADSSR